MNVLYSMPPFSARSLILGILAAGPLSAQVIDVRPVTPAAAGPLVATLKAAQLDFESFRKNNLPSAHMGRAIAGECDERVGRFCYWYDENESPPPKEPEVIAQARERLIARLDSSATAFPNDRWASGQLVRYLTEAEKYEAAVRAANRCLDKGWWCSALQGFAYHVAGQHATADAAFSRALAAMTDRERCEWRDMKMLLDDELLRDYRDLNCARRVAFEQRVWWLSRPLMSGPGSDARSEYFARVMMTKFLEDAPSVHASGFDADERELLLRYGWPRQWSREPGSVGLNNNQRGITGYEATPAHPMLPMVTSVQHPALSDSVGWRGKGLPGVRARYAPDYARRLLALDHQAALFRRGDSALVVLAWDARKDTALAAAAGDRTLQAALVLTRGEPGDATIVRAESPAGRGTLSALAPWGSTLMSAEVGAPARHTLARARYGMRATDLPGARVTVSDLLLFDPYDGIPQNLTEALAHARSSLRLPVNARIGIYWESYNTSSTGEGMQVSITVAPEEAAGGWLRRRLTSLRLVKEAKPVSVGMRDQSARGLAFTPRAVVVDLATLGTGRYLLQVEVTAENTAPVRAERVISVVRGGVDPISWTPYSP